MPEKLNDDEPSKETLILLHQTIKKVTEDLNTLSFNTAVSQMMIFVNHLSALENYNNAVLRQFLVLLNPFAPHVSEEIFEILGFNTDGPITSQSWPKYEQNFLSADTINIAVQINGKTRGVIELEANLSKETIIEKIIDNDIFKKYKDQNKPIEGVIHFAGFKSISESFENPFKYYENNVNKSIITNINNQPFFRTNSRLIKNDLNFE